MANLTPLDIRKKEFSQSAFGFNKDAVKLFLDEVVETMEKYIEEKNDLKKQIVALNEKLDGFQRLEKSINETLMMAKDSGKQAIATATKEAEATLIKAQTEKDALLFSAKEELAEIQNQTLEFKAQRDRFVIQFKASLNSHLELLESLNPVSINVQEEEIEPVIDFSTTELSLGELEEQNKNVSEEKEDLVEEEIIRFEEEE